MFFFCFGAVFDITFIRISNFIFFLHQTRFELQRFFLRVHIDLSGHSNKAFDVIFLDLAKYTFRWCKKKLLWSFFKIALDQVLDFQLNLIFERSHYKRTKENVQQAIETRIKNHM